jgi:hypothetical protein
VKAAPANYQIRATVDPKMRKEILERRKINLKQLMWSSEAAGLGDDLKIADIVDVPQKETVKLD